MDVRRMKRPGSRMVAKVLAVPALLAALVLGGVANGTFAQDAPGVKTAGIFAGTCDALGAEAVFALDDVALGDDDGRAPSGDPVGAAGATAVEFSDTQLSGAKVQDLLAQPHAIVVSGADGAVVACGEIGGYLYENEELFVGLRGESGAAGVAIIEGDDDDSEVDVTLYLVSDAAAPGTPVS